MCREECQEEWLRPSCLGGTGAVTANRALTAVCSRQRAVSLTRGRLPLALVAMPETSAVGEQNWNSIA